MFEVKSSWKKWQLLIENGRQVWAYQPSSTKIEDHLDNIGHFSDKDVSQFAKDFSFNRNENPNSTDKVFRNTTLNKNYKPFIGKIPQAENPQYQPCIDGLIKGIQHYSSLQSDDGHWAGDYGGPLFLLPGLIITAYITDTPLPAPHQELIKLYFLNHQREDGGWGLHIEGDSTIFGTVMQYVSLRLLGVSADQPALVKARTWIKTHGGAVGIPSWGKFYLSLLNLYDWQGFNSVFPEMWLFPKSLPFHPSRYWCHSRMVYLPMAYCYGHRINSPVNELILALREEIYNENYESIQWEKQRDVVGETDRYYQSSLVLKVMNFITNNYEKIKPKFLRDKSLNYILDYLNAEDEQTNYINIGPVNKVMNSLCIFHAYGKDSTQFKKHVERWFDYLWVAEDGMKMSGYNGSQLWDTAFMSRAMLESPIGHLFPETLQKSYQFIEATQMQVETPKQQQFFRHQSVGGWPFSTIEHGWPISDCTAEGLSATLALHHSQLIKPIIDETRQQQAIELILSYQNKEGGWATYENSRAPKWLEALNPSEIFADIMVDYSWTECTSACIQSLIEFQEVYPNYKPQQLKLAIKRGLSFILKKQKDDGSWYGGWAVCFTYATWFGVEALSQAKGKGYYDDKLLDKGINHACQFLVSKQQVDGGWGESFESCSKQVYTQSKQSQVVNTSWALLSLMAANFEDKTVIEKGINLLLERQTRTGDWLQENISGVFNYNCMITYTAYRNIFPIWALSRFYKKQLL